MAFEHYLRSGQKLLRCGYTTGTCAALAAGGAVRLLFGGTCPDTLSLTTPKGWTVETEPAECFREPDGNGAVCSVIKDAGDDPDITQGMRISARAERQPEPGITIDGGEGVGRVTKPGLDQPVGAAAINHVPREMIAREVREACAEQEYTGGVRIVISIPGGEETARHTFNPMLGIEGGLSVLGTSGVVEPMSEQAIVDTIAAEMHQAVLVSRRLILAPGNYGLDWLRDHGADRWQIPVVRCSNFIGEAMDQAAVLGFREVLLAGHAGKLVKLAGGIMNTHSRYADCRTELFCAHAAVCGAGQKLCAALLEAATTDACLSLLEEAGLRSAVTESLLDAIDRHMKHRADGAFAVGAVLFSSEYGLLGMTGGAKEILSEWNRQL